MATNSTPALARHHARAWPDDVADALGRAEIALGDERPREALEILERVKEGSPWLTNARAVCLLRMGERERALVAILTQASATSGHSLRDDVPTHFKTNYATAQLLAGNMTGCIVTLGQARDEGHPSVQRLRAALRQWRRSLTFWEK